MSMIEADVKVKFTLQCQWCRLNWTSSSLYNVSDAGWCECLVNCSMWIIQADMNV